MTTKTSDPMEAIRQLLVSMFRHDELLDDPNADGSGDDSRCPDGNDYSDLFTDVRTLGERVGIDVDALRKGVQEQRKAERDAVRVPYPDHWTT